MIIVLMIISKKKTKSKSVKNNKIKNYKSKHDYIQLEEESSSDNSFTKEK